MFFRSEPVDLQIQAIDLTSVPSHQLQGVLGHGCCSVGATRLFTVLGRLCGKECLQPGL